MVKKGLMADTWVVEVDIKVVLQVHAQLLPMILFQNFKCDFMCFV